MLFLDPVFNICAFYIFSVTDEDTVKRYYAKFEEKFFQTCEKELAKINTFYSGKDCSKGPAHTRALTRTQTNSVTFIRKRMFSVPGKGTFRKRVPEWSVFEMNHLELLIPRKCAF